MKYKDFKQWMTQNPRIPDDAEVEVYIPDYATILPIEVVHTPGGSKVVLYAYSRPGYEDKANVKQTRL